MASSTLSEKTDSPETQEVSAVDVPIASLGDDDADDDEGDSEEERDGDGSTAAAGSKGKRKAEAVEGDEAESDGSDQEDETAGETAGGAEVSGAAGDASSGAHPWQAVWSAEKNGKSGVMLGSYSHEWRLSIQRGTSGIPALAK